MSGAYRNNSGTKERVKLDDFSGKMRPFQSFFVVAFDADKHTNKIFTSYQGALVRELKENGCAAATADWDVSPGKGIDGLLCRGYIPEFNLR